MKKNSVLICALALAGAMMLAACDAPSAPPAGTHNPPPPNDDAECPRRDGQPCR